MIGIPNQRKGTAVSVASSDMMISAVNDKFTIDDVALKVCRALDLPRTNRELGRSVIRDALLSPSVGDFWEQACNYGTFDREFAHQLYVGIRSADARLKDAARARGCATVGSDAPKTLPFSRSFGGQKEQLPGEGAELNSKKPMKSSKGGLVIPKSKAGHVFAKPGTRGSLPSHLGLQALAAQKRAEQAAAVEHVTKPQGLPNMNLLSYVNGVGEASTATASRGTSDANLKGHRGGTAVTKKRARGRSAAVSNTTVRAEQGNHGSRSEGIAERQKHGHGREAACTDSHSDHSHIRSRDRRDRDTDGPSTVSRSQLSSERGDSWWEEPMPRRDSDECDQHSNIWPGPRRPSATSQECHTPKQTPDRQVQVSRGCQGLSGTALSTPSYNYNSWSKNRQTAGTRTSYRVGGGGSDLVSARADACNRAGAGCELSDNLGVELLAEEQDGALAARESEAWKAEDVRQDRDWYNIDEGGGFTRDEGYNPFMISDSRVSEYEERMKKERVGKHENRPGGGTVAATTSLRKASLNEDRDRWEESRLIGSGVVRQNQVQTSFDDSTEARTQLMVHDTKPPFLDGRTVFTTQQKMVLPVKDPTGTMSQIARKGSLLLRDVRDKRDRDKSQAKFWELSGSKMGNAMGLKKQRKKVDAADAMEENEAGELNYKKDSQYGSMKKSDAISEFARSKTMKEQREYLPIYGCREALLQVIRDNQVVVIVGETGSGKTTQMTQYLREDGYSDYGVVGCTQPRRVAAMSVAKRVSEEMGVELGADVGYAIRFEDCTSSSTVIKYMTDGVLLRESLNGDSLEQYSCIIMDEAHERSLHTDVLFGTLRKLLTKRRDMKLLVTSATMDAGKFADFYGVKN